MLKIASSKPLLFYTWFDINNHLRKEPQSQHPLVWWDCCQHWQLTVYDFERLWQKGRTKKFRRWCETGNGALSWQWTLLVVFCMVCTGQIWMSVNKVKCLKHIWKKLRHNVGFTKSKVINETFLNAQWTGYSNLILW